MKKIRKFNHKINKFFKKNILTFSIVSLIFIICGIILKNFENLYIFSVIAFLIATIFSGIPILFRALLSLKNKTISIELLVSIAVIGALFIKEFSECAIVTFLFQFGMFLEQKTANKTRSAIKELISLAPQKANRLFDDKIENIDIDDVQLNDILIVKEGEKIPVDGIIVKGEGYFIESAITGESLPRHKQTEEFIYAGAILESGYIQMKATRIGEDTTFSKIVNLVEEALENKSPLDKFIDRFAKFYTPIVILLSLSVLFILRFITGIWDIDKAITILVLACPGALVIGIPMASVAGIGRGAKEFILFKGGESLNSFSKSNVFIFDKTGTLTTGETKVLSNKYYGDNKNKDLLNIISLEQSSSHPLGKALISLGDELNIHPKSSIDIETFKGLGIQGIIEEDQYLIGNEKFLLSENIIFNKEQKDYINTIKNHGSSIILVAKNNQLIFIFEIGDKIKEEAKKTISKLKKDGVKRIIMLTGDNYSTASYVANQIGIDEFYSDLLPEDKLNFVKNLESSKINTTFIGDGINDSPSLACATTSIAMGNGTDVAIETSSVILMRSNLEDIEIAYRLSKKTIIVSYENVIISLLTVILLIIGLFLDYIHMSLGMLIHEASIFIVILNAMRLLIKKKEKK